MSKNIFIKLLICSIFVFALSTLFCMSSIYAIGDIFSKGKEFLEVGNNIDETIKTTELEKTSDYIYNTLLGIGIMVAIVVAMVLGIQFMAASADEKAKVKEALMPYVVGCIVVFGAFTIWKLVVNMGNKAEDSIVGTSSSGYSSAIDASIATSHITDGELSVKDLSDAEIKDLYSNNRISSNLRDKMYGTAYRPKQEKDYLTIEEALNEMGETAQKIYNEAKARGLLQSNGIDLK